MVRELAEQLVRIELTSPFANMSITNSLHLMVPKSPGTLSWSAPFFERLPIKDIPNSMAPKMAVEIAASKYIIPTLQEAIFAAQMFNIRLFVVLTCF